MVLVGLAGGLRRSGSSSGDGDDEESEGLMMRGREEKT